MNPVVIFLSSELEKRQARNKRFSKRAFANLIGMEPSAFAKILKGERIPNLSTFQRALQRLCVKPEEISETMAWVETVNESPKHFSSYDNEYFENVLGISHLLVLEALRVPQFADSLQTLQKAMGLSPAEFDRIIGDLEKMNMLEHDSKNNRVQILKCHNTTLPIAPTTAKLRQLQKDFLKLAIEAIENVPIERRHNSTLTLAIPFEKLDSFKEELAKFRRKLVIDAEKEILDSNCVYNFSFAVYPVVPPVSEPSENLSNAHVLSPRQI